MHVVAYNKQSYEIIRELPASYDENWNYWLYLPISDTKTIHTVCQQQGIHPLIIEDIFSTSQLPKLELFDDYHFFTYPHFHADMTTTDLTFSNISQILKKNLVITVGARPESPLIPHAMARIEKPTSFVRQRKSDYLLYWLTDFVVDHYLALSEWFRDLLEDLEDDVLEQNDRDYIPDAIQLRKQVTLVRRYTSPLREAVDKLKKEAPDLIAKKNMTYWQDIHDHLIHTLSSLESFREMSRDIIDLHHSQLNYQSNEVMKTLTVIASIFIPLTFIAGVYGMNFEHMPELQWPWAYPALMGIMVALALGLVYYMRRRHWF